MRTLIASLLALVVAAPAAAKTYSAERFDVRIRILQGGAMEVVETVVFRFEDGTFDHVFRDLPRRRNDAIEIVSAEMDGRPLSFGRESGQVEIRRESKLRVRWRFAPRSQSTHTFALTYVVQGVVQRQAGHDVLEWTALPVEHDYRIDQSEVVLELPAAPLARPTIATKRVDAVALEPGGQRVQVLARGIGRNGWLQTRLEFGEGVIIAAAPAWQQRQIAARAVAPRWMTAAGIVFGLGLMFLLALRQRYESPQDVAAPSGTVEAPPDALRPGIAGALAANGTAGLQQAMAALFALADRGVITISQEPRKWGQRQYTIHRRQTNQPLAAEETAVLNLAFRHKNQPQEAVTLAQARHGVARRIGEFKTAVNHELRALGVLDDDRMRARARFLGFSIAFLSLAAVLIIPAIFLARQYEGWPFLIPAAVAAVAIVGFITYGALTPLSNEGIGSAARWRAYQKHLKDVARERVQLTSDESPARVLSFAVALGLAGVWSKYVKNHPTGLPPWFRAIAVSGDEGGFPAFIAASGAGADAGAGGGAGGAAGGGASGAG